MNKKRFQSEKSVGDGKIISDDSSSRIVEHESPIGSVLGTVHTGSGNIKISAFPSEYELSEIEKFANYLEEVSPSEINEPLILQLEKFLYNLYRKSAETKSNRQAIEVIKNALSISSSLSSSIKHHPGGVREQSFFLSLFDLRELLQKVYTLLAAQYK
jgi:hypothetical protein